MTNTSGAAAPQEPNRLSALSVPQIHRLMAVEADTIAKAKSRLDALQGEVSARFKEEVTAAYDRAGKVSGVVRIPLPDGYELTADATKAIKWDSAKLLQVARFMAWEQVQRPLSSAKRRLGKAGYGRVTTG